MYYLVVIAGNLSCDHPARDLKVEEYLPFLREFVAALLKVLFREAAEAKLATQNLSYAT